MSVTNNRYRIPCDTAHRTSLQDRLTNGSPVLFKASATRFELARLVDELIPAGDMDAITGIRLQVRAAQFANSVSYLDKSTDVINGALTKEQWDAGTDQHAAIAFTDEEMNITLGGAKKVTSWMDIWAITAAGNFILVSGSVIVQEGPALGDDGELQGPNIVPSGATYDEAGEYELTVNGGELYLFRKGANDTGYDNGGGPIGDDGYFTAAAGTVTLEGIPDAAVTATVRNVETLMALLDARYAGLFRYIGPYDDDFPYDASNGVTSDGSMWGAKIATMGNPPPTLPTTSNTWWELLASKGDQGEPGVTYYTYVAYASDNDGADFSLTPGDDLKYVAFAISTTPLAPEVEDFEGQWVKYVGGFVVNFKGQWKVSGVGANYDHRDFVKRTGSIYYSLQDDNEGHLPEEVDSEWWALFLEASNIQLSDTLPTPLTVGDVGAVGTDNQAARGTHSHPMPGLSTQSAAGFESAADKRRFDFSEIGGPNGSVIKVLRATDGWSYVFGDFTKWDNVAAPGIAKIDSKGHVDPIFNAGTGLYNAATPAVIQPIYFAVETSDGGIVFASNAKTIFNGGAAIWLHKIDSTGAVDGGFTSPGSIAATGSDAILSLVSLSDNRLAVLSWQTFRVLDEDGTTLATANGEVNLHSLATAGPTGDKVWLMSRRDADYEGISISTGVKLLDLSGATIDQDTDWLVGATEGADFDADRAILAPDGWYAIIATNTYYGSGTFAWNSGPEVAQGLIKLLPDGTQDETFAPVIVRTSAPIFVVPLAVDSLGRVYFTGAVVSVNGTAVTANRLYRVDADGDGLVEFTGFNGAISGVTLGADDDHLMVTGYFTAYGQLPVSGIVFINSTGNRIYSLDIEGAGGGGVAEEYDYTYIPAAMCRPRLTGGATADQTETPNYYINSDVYRFPKATKKYVQVDFKFPAWWNLLSVRVLPDWEPATGATAGDKVVLSARALALSDGDTIDVPMGALALSKDTVIGVGIRHDGPVAELTVGGSPATGDSVVWEFAREIDDDDDDMAEEVILRGWWVQFKKLTTPTELLV